MVDPGRELLEGIMEVKQKPKRVVLIDALPRLPRLPNKKIAKKQLRAAD
jgi:hypothetical protein